VLNLNHSYFGFRMTPEVPPPKQIPLLDLIGVFFRVGVTSFGGSTAAWLYKEVVERRGWLDDEHFTTALTLAQVLPGANPVNLSIYIGSQLRGGIGGAAAAIGMVAPPFVIILILGYLYRQFGSSPVAHAVLAGLAAVGVGMTLTIGVKLARKVRRPIPIAIAVTLFVTVGVLHWPMIPMVLAMTPLSIGLEHLQAKKRTP